MKNLSNLLTALKNRTFKITVGKDRKEKIQQTDSNKLKQEVADAIAQDIAEITPYIYKTDKGYLLEIENQSIADNITNEDGSGAITVEIVCVVKGLDTDAKFEGECYTTKQEEKAEKAKVKAEEKARKIARDEADRKAKKEKAE